MKIEIYLILLILSLTKASIVLQTRNKKIIPESNKLQIQITRNSDPILIETENEIKQIHSHTSKMEVVAPEIDEVPESDIYNNHHRIYTDNENPVEETPHENSIRGHDLINEDIGTLHSLVNSDHSEVTEDTMNSITNEENISMLESIKNELTRPLTKDEKHLNIAYSQIEELETNLTDLLEKNKTEETLQMDPKTLKTLVSYMEHLDYIKHHEENSLEKTGLPPSLPDHFRSKEEPVTLNEAGKLETPTVGEEELINEELVDKLHKEIKELEEEIEIAKSEHLSEDELMMKEGEKMGLEEELDEVEDETDGERQKEDLEEEIGKIERIEGELEGEGGHAETVVELEKEKQHLEEEDLELEDKEVKVDEVKVFKEKIMEVEKELFEAQREGDEELEKKLNAELVLLKNEKETLEQERIDPDEQELDPQMSKKENGENSENTLEIENVGLETDENGYVGEGKNYENIPNLLVIIQGISAGYNALFEDLPDNKEAIPKDPTTQLKEGLELYAKLRNFIIAITANREKLKTDIEYIKKNIDSLNLTKTEILGFYDLQTLYTKNKDSVKDKALSHYTEKESEIQSETENFSKNIKTLTKSADTLLSIDDLLYKETEYLRSNMDQDDTLDAIKKVDATILLLPKLIDFKIEIDEVVKGIKEDFGEVEGRRAKLKGYVEDLGKIGDGSFEAMKVDPLDVQEGVRFWSFVMMAFLLFV